MKVSSIPAILLGALLSIEQPHSIHAFTTRSFISTNQNVLQPQLHSKKSIASILTNPKGTSTSNSRLNLSSNNNLFDVSKPTFDLLTLRSIRGDAILQYNSLNQSEPLRINLYALLSLTLLAFPTISESVLGESSTTIQTIASTLGGLGSFGLFLRECGKRSKQLKRIEKEFNAEYLKLKLPLNRFADRAVGGSTVSLRVVRGKKRVLALCGTASQLKEALIPFRVLRRRIVQSSSVVVVVSTDGSKKADWGLSEEEIKSVPWLAEAVDIDAEDGWLSYFSNLQPDNNDNNNSINKLTWFGLTNNGRSFGSGVGEDNLPRIFEILGQNLLPVDVLDEDDAADQSGNDVDSLGVVKEVLDAQKTFYDALTSGDLGSMQGILSEEDAEEVTEVLQGGGRVDKWQLCLEEGARPSDMNISGSDVLLLSNNKEAYSTTVEFPPNAGIDGATLLAVQRWKRHDTNGEWKLVLHQTIPWCPGSKAGGTLRCDCRGCTALTSSRERRTFGGLIG